jgi:hypothetical protein
MAKETSVVTLSDLLLDAEITLAIRGTGGSPRSLIRENLTAVI